MNAREWEPGDVAMVVNAAGEDRVARFTGKWGDVVGEPHWAFADGSTLLPHEVTQARPLVVIDPEDREQVERLAKAWASHIGEFDTIPSRMQAALREFANPTPPKPDEPTGRYAVVLDSDDVEWLRDRDGTWCYLTQQAPGLTRWRVKKWDDIDVVRVLSEGVQP